MNCITFVAFVLGAIVVTAIATTFVGPIAILAAIFAFIVTLAIGIE